MHHTSEWLCDGDGAFFHAPAVRMRVHPAIGIEHVAVLGHEAIAGALGRQRRHTCVHNGWLLSRGGCQN
eukprot:COSAG01_NODE_155_length_23814_cov_12.061343_16_plen_69_part_00